MNESVGGKKLSLKQQVQSYQTQMLVNSTIIPLTNLPIEKAQSSIRETV
jgi:hypothetical protein